MMTKNRIAFHVFAIENGYPDAGKCHRKIRNGCPDAGNGQRKIKMAVPIRDEVFKNQNMVSQCGTGILKTEWGFPEAGRSD